MKRCYFSQSNLISCIERYHAENGCAPTYQDLSDMTGLPKTKVFTSVKILIKLGFLERNENKSRTLRLKR